MKNITIKLFVLVICMFSLTLQAQVSPVNKEMADKLEKQRKEYKRKQMADKLNNDKEELQLYNFIELIVYNVDGKLKIREDDLDLNIVLKNDYTSDKVEFLTKLISLVEKGNVNLVSLLGSQGIKIISHSFISTKKEGEKHIYILEI